MNEQIDMRTEEGSKRLIELLTNGGSGMMDLIWGPELELGPQRAMPSSLGKIKAEHSQTVDLVFKNEESKKQLDEAIDKVRYWGK